MRPTCLALLLILFSVSSVPADQMKIERDISYSDAGGKLTGLDVYAPAEGTKHPVVVWIHGGGWRRGDKSRVHEKPTVFTSKGYVLVSINYRLSPHVTYREQGQDIARAIRWVRDNIDEYGGDPEKLLLMGHSAGAHLAALVATDESYLGSEKLKLDALSGVILLDGAGYDIPRQLRLTTRPRAVRLYTTVFGENETKQRDASPITHIEQGRGIPPFLVLYVADRPDSGAQSKSLAEKLNESGVEATAVAAQNKTHGTISTELGQEGDEPTRAVLCFLKEHTGE